MTNLPTDNMIDIVKEYSDLSKANKGKDSFNIMNVVGAKRKELIFSRTLAWLLDWRADHEYGNKFFLAFAYALGIHDVDSFSPDDYVVYKEMSMDKSRIDISIYKRGQFLFFLENKTISSEGYKQLERERSDLEDLQELWDIKTDKCHLVFITPDGRKPITDNTDNKDPWTSLGFEELSDALRRVLTDKENKTNGFINDILDWYDNMSNNKITDFTNIDNLIIDNIKNIQKIHEDTVALQTNLIERVARVLTQLDGIDSGWTVKKWGDGQRYMVHKECERNSKDIIWIGLERFFIDHIFSADPEKVPWWYVFVFGKHIEIINDLKEYIDPLDKSLPHFKKISSTGSYVFKYEFESISINQLKDIDEILEKRINQFFGHFLKFTPQFIKTISKYLPD